MRRARVRGTRRHQGFRREDRSWGEVRLRRLDRRSRNDLQLPAELHLKNVPPRIVMNGCTEATEDRRDRYVCAPEVGRLRRAAADAHGERAARYQQMARRKPDTICDAGHVRRDGRLDPPALQKRMIVRLNGDAVEQNGHGNGTGWEYHGQWAIFSVE